MPPVIADKTAEDTRPIKSISSPVCHHFGKLEVYRHHHVETSQVVS